VVDEYRKFLSKNQSYLSTKKHIFNGKEETILRPWRMTPCAWKLQYNRVSQGMDRIVYVSLYMICLDYFIFLWNFLHYTNW